MVFSRVTGSPTLLNLSRDSFQYEQRLGDGAFGQVFKAVHVASTQVVAVKQISKDRVWKLLGQLQREISISYQLQHQNIVKMLGHFEDAENVYLVMEFAEGGNLYSRLKKEKQLEERVAAKYFYQVVSAVEYLHSQTPAIVHRDIKPENILLTSDDTVLLTDFGWSNYYNVETAVPRTTVCGTLEYLPPEMVEESGHSTAADIWCLGILLYEMIMGVTPFKRPTREGMLHGITSLEPKFSPSFPPLAKELVLKMINKSADLRPSITEVKEDKWLADELTGRKTEILRDSLMESSLTSFRLESESNESRDDLQFSLSTTSFQEVEVHLNLKDNTLALIQECEERITARRIKYLDLMNNIEEARNELAKSQASQQRLASELRNRPGPLNRQLVEARSLLMEKTYEKKITEGLLKNYSSEFRTNSDLVLKLETQFSTLQEAQNLLKSKQTTELRELASDLLLVKLKRNFLRSKLQSRFPAIEAGFTEIERKTVIQLCEFIESCKAKTDVSTINYSQVQENIAKMNAAVEEKEASFSVLKNRFNDLNGVLLQELRKDKDSLILQVRERKRVIMMEQQEVAVNMKMRITSDLEAVQRVSPPPAHEYQSSRKQFTHLLWVRNQLASRLNNLKITRQELSEQVKSYASRISELQLQLQNSTKL